MVENFHFNKVDIFGWICQGRRTSVAAFVKKKQVVTFSLV